MFLKLFRYTNQTLVLVFTILITVLSSVSAQAQSVDYQPPYAPGDTKVTRNVLTSRTTLLTFNNFNILDSDHGRMRSQTWMVAGARGRAPVTTIESANFTLIQNGQEVMTTQTVPAQITQNLLRLDELGQFRQYWLYSLNVKTMSPASVGGFWVLKDAVVRLELGEPTTEVDPDVASRWTTSFGGEELLPNLVLNWDISPEFYVTSYTDPVQSWKNWATLANDAASTGGLFRFSVYSGGFYRLAPADFNEFTSSPISTDPTRWRVYHNGQEIPVVADRQDPTAAIYLPVKKSDGDGLVESVYWLDVSDNNKNGQPLRLQAAGAVAAGADVIESATVKIMHRELADYNPKLKPGPGSDRWYWGNLAANSPLSLELEFPDYYAPVEGTGVKALVTYGFANFPAIQPDMLFQMLEGDASRTSLTTQLGTATLDIPADRFQAGSNAVALRLDYPLEETSNRPVSVQHIITQWEQQLLVPEGSSYFIDTEGPSTTSTALRFSSALPDKVMVLGFNTTESVLLAANADHVPVGMPGIQQYLVANTTHPDLVSKIRAVEPFDYSIRSAKSVIVAAPELVNGSRELADLHKKRGLSAVVYNVEDLYNAFSFGSPDPEAIRSALRYMYFMSEGDIPEYVTIVGEASDFRGDPRLAPPAAQLDMVPSAAANTPETPQGDDRYGSVIGPDIISDFIVGRIPASTPAELTGYLEKSVAFESAPEGPWSRIAQFAMDDNDEFPDVVARIQKTSLSPVADTQLLRQWDYEYVPNQRVQGRKRSWGATEALISSINQGMGILNYFGHGGPNLWSHERLFHLSDLELLSNGSRLPLMTCASCDNAWITYPMPPVKKSMGEDLVLLPDAGAIGLFGPVAGASPYEHSTLVQNLMESILRLQIRHTGDATLYAKNLYFAKTRSTAIPEQYLLLGDPTIGMRLPVVESGLNDYDGDIRVGANPFAVVLLDHSKTLTGEGVLRLVQAENGRELGSVETRPRQARWNVPLPADFQGGAAMALLEWDDDGTKRYIGGMVSILPPMKTFPEGTGLKQVRASGNRFTLRSVFLPEDTVNRSLPIYGFEIETEQDYSGQLRVEAQRGGIKLAEASGIQMTTGTRIVSFEISGNIAEESGESQVDLVVYAQGETDEGPLASVTFLVPPLPRADLEFVAGTARVYSDPEPMLAHKTVLMEAELRNVGNALAEKISLQAMQGSPTTGTELVTINSATATRIESLKPGESQKITFRWEAATAGTHNNIYLVANRNKSVPEFNLDNNHILLPSFTVGAMGNYVVSDLKVSPRFVSPNDLVSVTAVLTNNAIHNQRPVSVEMGWERSFDSSTTAANVTKTRFRDGVSTISRTVRAVPGYTHLYVKVNSDADIEEMRIDDNTAKTESITVFEIEPFEQTFDLADSLTWGAAYNLDRPFEGSLQVSTEFTSKSLRLITVNENDIGFGNAVKEDKPDDNAWYVVNWRVNVGDGENPGEIGFRKHMDELTHDLPGRLFGHFFPYPQASPPVNTRLASTDPWITPRLIGSKRHRAQLDFGIYHTRDRYLSWEMKKAGAEGFSMEYLTFVPTAIQWDSPPYHLDESLRGQIVRFAMDTNEEAWDNVYFDWRSGTAVGNGDIAWKAWVSTTGTWMLDMETEEYMQIRIIGVPQLGKHPIINNFRIERQ